MKLEVTPFGCAATAIVAVAAIIIHRDAQGASLARRELDQSITAAMQNAVDGMGQFKPGPSYWDEKGLR